jgi:hypothetical protein
VVELLKETPDMLHKIEAAVRRQLGFAPTGNGKEAAGAEVETPRAKSKK